MKKYAVHEGKIVMEVEHSGEKYEVTIELGRFIESLLQSDRWLKNSRISMYFNTIRARRIKG